MQPAACRAQWGLDKVLVRTKELAGWSKTQGCERAVLGRRESEELARLRQEALARTTRPPQNTKRRRGKGRCRCHSQSTVHTQSNTSNTCFLPSRKEAKTQTQHTPDTRQNTTADQYSVAWQKGRTLGDGVLVDHSSASSQRSLPRSGGFTIVAILQHVGLGQLALPWHIAMLMAGYHRHAAAHAVFELVDPCQRTGSSPFINSSSSGSFRRASEKERATYLHIQPALHNCVSHSVPMSYIHTWVEHPRAWKHAAPLAAAAWDRRPEAQRKLARLCMHIACGCL
ncbi:hypothetical protein K437DRAFT_68823 [Tilletiaria anomala UBC 951]|uniref:Uncharacterized protein n=1 Tax=Tilletiaria anomala (strain ATCC 24038 / CBS 436.72 / UBC 951) TaxID=1037660 RepID=A0A066WQU0_TILAU|nr:uncharacterized protein K437DRAFT_68823 [Tilletiaria anomala UBC 951]KDN53344.1 hypothetical protein K437DRAFT_68823 [Tilletiaria anomala UBC 951]